MTATANTMPQEAENRFQRSGLPLPDLIAPPAPATQEPEAVRDEPQDEEPTQKQTESPKRKKARQAVRIAEPLEHLSDVDEESSGSYKVVVEIPTAFDDVLTASLVGKRWARVDKKVGKLAVLRAIILAVLRRVDFSKLDYSDPDQLEDQILRALIASD